ncbi:hypothetical protein HPC49_20300 [Pyxidicoccus fallax]|uniref:Uncharacterized protein n=1 Tax=Pyxidicoccus fallax TaxID=394095 RepID=A0A848LQM4_9BACT|nr:hypothetical protein [Pyxidicoccus fallax]NMO19942.1 hypothetical protein [Pyxidicoccus fallax]NPC80554.1 hypothetical protein [Pyxidicoccus fallax]
MDVWRILLAPLYAMCLMALVVAAFTFGRRDAAARPWRLPLLWFGLLATASFFIASRFSGEAAGPVLLSAEAATRAGGAALLVLAAAVAVRGSWARSRADLLRSSAPKALDEAVASLRAGDVPGWGVYQGTLDAADALTSPGGVPCAFYDAEVRQVAEDGRKGPLLSRERAYSPVLHLRGERVSASVRFAPSSLMAPLEVRRCEALPGTVPASWYEDAPEPEAGVQAQAQAVATEPEALSWERVGAPGERCLVVGELRRGAREGSYVLCGRNGGPALVVLGPELPVTGGTLLRRAWTHFAAAGALSTVAALILARGL